MAGKVDGNTGGALYIRITERLLGARLKFNSRSYSVRRGCRMPELVVTCYGKCFDNLLWAVALECNTTILCKKQRGTSFG